MTDAFIYDAVCTPRDRNKKDDALHSVGPANLVAELLCAVQRHNGLDTAQVDDIVLGCMTPMGDQGTDTAKTAALVVDWDEQVAGVQINCFCTSGLETVNLGTTKVRSGFEDLVLVGDVEFISRAPVGSDGGAWALDSETNLHISFVPQKIGADLIATLEDFNCADVDAFALRSQQKTAKTRAEGLFGRPLVPVADQNGIVLFDRDEFTRTDFILEESVVLKPNFEMMGQVGLDVAALRKYNQIEHIEHMYTPGNSSGIISGASAVLIGSGTKGHELGLRVRTWIVVIVVTSTGLTIMLTGSTPATREALAKAGLEVEDIDLFEISEAFALVVMKLMRGMDVAESRVSVNSGIIAMGHPLGATGCIIPGTLPDKLEWHNLRYSLAILCVGGGMGIVTIIERV